MRSRPRGGVLRSLVLAAAAAFLVAVGASAVSAGAGWQIVASPDVPQQAGLVSLYGVACPGATRCFAVGSVTGVGGQQSLIEAWDGLMWSTVAHADPAGATAVQLHAVACADANDCFAVGSLTFNLHGPEALILRWNGISWSVVPSATRRASANLYGVTCLDATTCYAVGTLINAGSLIERWNGSAWSTVPTPGVPGGSGFAGVACAQSSRCFAVGSRSTGQPVIAQSDGAAWSVVTSPTAPGVAELSGVACPAVTSCFAVGGTSVGSEAAALLAHWDGTGWSRMSAARGISGPYNLHGVACAGPSNCFAVGESHTSTVVLGWDGTAWSFVATPNPQTLNTLSAVACVSSTTCAAVGTHAFMATLADQWDGARWTPQPSPNPAQPSDALTAVTCASATNCFAVGRTAAHSGEDYRTLIEHWNGTAWSITPSADILVGLIANDLESVSCANATRCFAVGSSSSDSTPTETFVQQWDGSTWSLVSLAPPSTRKFAVLSSVSCPGARRCYAVGRYLGKKLLPLVEQWDGKAWSRKDGPIRSTVDGAAFASVACPNSSRCFAVGYQHKGQVTTTLVEHWNGSVWTPVASANPGGSTDTSLTAVSCATATSCVAIGSSHSNGTTRPIAERWDGTRWSLTGPLASAGPAARLASIACTGATNCTAVGRAVLNGTTAPLVERWNGARWSIEASASREGALSSSFSGIGCSAAGGCYAVGNTEIDNATTTLIEHRP